MLISKHPLMNIISYCNDQKGHINQVKLFLQHIEIRYLFRLLFDSDFFSLAGSAL